MLLDKQSYILMVFEGEKTELQIVESLKRFFLNESKTNTVFCFHCGNIYSLADKLKNDEDLELFVLLKENLRAKNTNLKEIQKEQISEMYLFFDYDSHAPAYNNTKLESMLKKFNNETEEGKLYISYPMVEAIKHLKINVDFENTKAKSSRSYKQLVAYESDNKLKNLSKLTKPNWKLIIEEHCKKANFIMQDKFKFPEDIIEQEDIFKKQKAFAKRNDNCVCVLSAFPLFLLDYYGAKPLFNKISK